MRAYYKMKTGDKSLKRNGYRKIVKLAAFTDSLHQHEAGPACNAALRMVIFSAGEHMKAAIMINHNLQHFMMHDK